MAFSPASFYTLADELRLKATADGPHLRTLISRAYYGALIEARDAKRVNTTGGGGHQKVIDSYKGPQGNQLVADSLRTLRSLREKADYEPATALKSADGQIALSSCRRVLQALNKLPSPVPLTTKTTP